MRISSHTALYGIFGNPVRHSLSPLMHNHAFRLGNIDAVYCAFEPDSIGDAIAAMRTLGIMGASVTIPFKIDVLKHVDSVDTLAQTIGAANTLVRRDNRVTAFNTDGPGALRALVEAAPGTSSALIIGNGGSARAIAFTLVSKGWNVALAGRNISKVTSLAQDIGGDVAAFCIDELDTAIMTRYGVIINTTPLGMSPSIDTTPLRKDLLLPDHTVFDIVYSPHATRFLQDAVAAGAKPVYGIDMLLYQGVLQFELWTGESAPVDEMRTILQENL